MAVKNVNPIVILYSLNQDLQKFKTRLYVIRSCNIFVIDRQRLQKYSFN